MGAELPVTSAIERSVLILGSHSLQNKLLAKLIGERTGYPCEMRPYERLSRSGTPPLVLIDSGECTEQLPTLCASGLFPSIAIINVPVINDDAPMHAEEVISYPGIKGLFCADVSEDQLIRGIEAIFDGQYWLPRRLLCLHLERTRVRIEPPAAAGMLTRKELQTLRLLATGNSTEHIAAELKVSPHTVKTHIYNLFRKINVSNRLQAVHWAARHVPGVEIAGPR